MVLRASAQSDRFEPVTPPVNHRRRAAAYVKGRITSLGIGDIPLSCESTFVYYSHEWGQTYINPEILLAPPNSIMKVRASHIIV